MIDYSKELFRLRTFYNLFIQLLSTHFSGYFLLSSEEINRVYLRLCIQIENILKQKEFKQLDNLEWKPFDNLLAIDSDTDLDWEYGRRRTCLNFQSEIENLFLRNGEKEFELDENDEKLFTSINTFLEQYEKEKDDKKRMHNIIKELMPNFPNNSNKNQTPSIKKTNVLQIPKDSFQGIMKVFISHKFVKEDQELALLLRNTLREKDIDGYLAESEKEYELLLSEKIRKRIENHDYVVGIITKQSENSSSVNQELGYALGFGIPVLLLVEENVKHGVLTHGREIEEFTRSNFKEHCEYIREYILERGKKKRLSDQEKVQLIQNVYEPCYNQLKNEYDRSEFIATIPSNPWKDKVSHAWKLKTESEIRQLFEKYSNELKKWHELWIGFANAFQEQQHKLGKIVAKAFDAAGMLHGNDHVQLDEKTTMEPRMWLHAFNQVIFDPEIKSAEELYHILLDYAQKTKNGHAKWIEEWWKSNNGFYSNLLELLPELTNNFKCSITKKQLDEQRNVIKKCIEELTSGLEDKLKQ